MTAPPPLPPAPGRGRPTLLPAAAVAALGATGLQVGWLERVKAQVAAGADLSPRALAEAARATVGLDAVLGFLALGLALALAARAARAAARAPAGLAALVPATRVGRLALLLLGTWTFVRWHASPGALAGFDLDLHAAHVALVADELRAGRVPSWTDAWYLGFPLLRYYGAAYYLPAGALAVGLDDVRTAVKATAAVWHLAAAPAGYALARATGAARGPALLAGLAYGASPFFVNTLAHLGSLTAAPVIALAPALLASALRAGRGEGWRPAVRAGAAGAGLVLAHPAYATLAAALAAVGFLGAAVGSPVRPRAALAAAAVATVTAALGALPVVLAWLLDGLPRAGTAPGVLGLLRPAAPNPEALGFLVRWSPRPPVTATGYLGLTVLALAALGVVARRGRAGTGLAVVGAATVLSWCGPGYVRERSLLLLPAVLVPAVAAGLAVPRRLGLGVVVVGALLADLGVGNLASPYRADLDPLAADLARLAAPGEPRTVLVATAPDGRARAGEWQVAAEAPLPSFLGGFREAAPGTYGALRATVEAVAEDPALRDDALRRHLVALGGGQAATLVGRRVGAVRSVRAPLHVGFAPAGARAATPAPAAPTADQVLAWSAAMVPPPGSAPGALARVVVAGDGPPLPADDAATPLPGPTVHADRAAGPVRVLDVEVPGPGTLRVAAAHTADLRVTRADPDGTSRDVPSTPDVMGLVLVDLPAAGRYRLTLRHPDRFGAWPAPALAALALLVSAAPRRRRRGAAPDAGGA